MKPLGDQLGAFMGIDPAQYAWPDGYLVDSHEESVIARIDVLRFLSALPPREGRVVAGYFGEGMTLRELAERYEVTCERIRQLLIRGLGRARKASRFAY